MKDLSSLAGFPLQFDPESRAVVTSDNMPLKTKTRLAKEMRDVLCEPGEVSSDWELYYMLYPERLPPLAADALAAHQLTLSLVLLPPLRTGREFVKTAGHYHDPMPGTSLGYPEIYCQLHGRQLLFLQKPDPRDRAKPTDCVLIDLAPGTVVEIPPGYVHVLINNSREPALLAGLYRKDMHHDYEPVRAMKGLAYHILNGPDGFVAQANPAYVQTPPINRIASVSGTLFEPPEPSTPLLSVFLACPDRYAFLSDSEAAVSRYGPSGDARPGVSHASDLKK